MVVINQLPNYEKTVHPYESTRSVWKLNESKDEWSLHRSFQVLSFLQFNKDMHLGLVNW